MSCQKFGQSELWLEISNLGGAAIETWRIRAPDCVCDCRRGPLQLVIQYMEQRLLSTNSSV